MTLARAEQAKDLAYTEPARARRLAEPLLGLDPETASVAHHAVGMAWSAVGRLGAAERHLRLAVSVASRAGLVVRAAQARGSLGYVLTLTGRTSEALRALDRVPSGLDGVSAARLLMQRALILTEIGRFAEAAAGFDAALARNPGDVLLEATIRNNRGLLRAHRRDWRGAAVDLDRAERLYVAAGHSGRVAMVFHNRAVAAEARGDVPAALALFDEAAARYAAAGRNPGLLPIERAEVLLSVRLVGEARAAASAAVAEFARQRAHVDLVQARLLAARVALVAGEFAVALEEASRARRSALRQGRPGWAAFAGCLALRARWEAGTASPAMARRVVAELEVEGWVVAALDARLIVARLALERSASAIAREELGTVAASARRGPAELRARAWHATALLRLSDGDLRGAEAALRSGVDVLAAFRNGLGAIELRAHASGHAEELAATGMRLALASKEPASVLGWAERHRAGSLRIRPVRPPDDTGLARDLAELRHVVAQQETGDQRKLLRRQAELENAIKARARHATGVHTTDPLPSTADLTKALHTNTLIEYVESGAHFHAVVLTDGRLTLHDLGPTAPITKDIEALRFGLTHLAHRMGSPRALAAISERVEQAARNLKKALLTTTDRPLVIVPTGALHALPYAAITTNPVTVAPSAALWLRAATAKRKHEGHVFAAGPGLEHAVSEVTTLQRRYPGAVRFTGNRAKATKVLEALDGAELAHIAAHGKFRADNPLFSRLELADGPLTVYDLERLKTPPRHVVLSACELGSSGVKPGDELLGLAAALLALGTQTLVASLVPVPDEASKRLMLRYHQHLKKGHDPAEALAKARSSWVDVVFQCYGAASPLVREN